MTMMKKHMKWLCFGGQFKGKCRNCGKIGHNPSSAKFGQVTMVEITAVTRLEEFIAYIVASWDVSNRNA
jgi:hypothetical protein